MEPVNILKAIEERITDMEVLPDVVTRLLAFTEDDRHSTKDVVRVIENDPVLTTRVLKVANSAYYAPRHPVETLHRAVVQLGEKTVTGVAIEACLASLYNNPLEGYLSAAGELWDHSLRTAIAAQNAAKYSRNRISGDLAFTAGLLHDIGKSIISEFLRGNTTKLVSWLEGGMVKDFLEAEQDLLGTDHAAVGHNMALRWKLPEVICEAIRHHHQPSLSSDANRLLVYTVHIGDIMAMLGGSGTGIDTLAYKIDPGYRDYIQINKDDFAKILLDVQEEFSAVKSFIFSGK